MTLTRRQKKWAIIVASVVVVFALIITFLPMIVRKVAVKQIAAATQRATTIEDVDINLFTRRIAIKNFRIADKTRPDAFVQFKDLALKFYYLPLFRGHLKLAELNLAAPAIGLARTGPSEFNFSDLLAGEKKEEKKEKGGFDITVDRFKLSDGIIVLEDSVITPAKSWKAEGLNFEAADLSTRATGPAGKATLNLTLAGTPISINASELHLTPTNGQAALKFEGFDLALLLPYVPSDTPATLQSGRLGVALTLKYGGKEGAQLDGDVRLEKIAVLQQGKPQPFLSAPELKINFKNINVNNGVFTIAAVEVSGDPTVVDTSLTPPSQFDLSKLKIAVEKLSWPQSEPALLQINSQLPKRRLARRRRHFHGQAGEGGFEGPAQGRRSLRVPALHSDIRAVGGQGRDRSRRRRFHGRRAAGERHGKSGAQPRRAGAAEAAARHDRAGERGDDRRQVAGTD